jgi:hypothetical protein
MDNRATNCRGFALGLALVAGGLAGEAQANTPRTNFEPAQSLCEAQGGVFGVSIDFISHYCSVPAEPGFTEEQLRVQEVLCVRAYGGEFGVQFRESPLPRLMETFCNVPTEAT